MTVPMKKALTNQWERKGRGRRGRMKMGSHSNLETRSYGVTALLFSENAGRMNPYKVSYK